MITYKWQNRHTVFSGVVYWSFPNVYVRLSILVKQEFLAFPSLIPFLLTREEAGSKMLPTLSVHKCTKCSLKKKNIGSYNCHSLINVHLVQQLSLWQSCGCDLKRASLFCVFVFWCHTKGSREGPDMYC